MIDYSPLWETMKQRHISQYALINKGIDKHTLDQLRKNQNITILTVEKLCNILNCTPNDVFAFKDEKDLYYRHSIAIFLWRYFCIWKGREKPQVKIPAVSIF